MKLRRIKRERWTCIIEDSDELFILVQALTTLESEGYSNYDFNKGHNIRLLLEEEYDSS